MWVLADQLTRAGFATLRTDSRGFGGSGGAFATASLEDLAGDTAAALSFLRSLKDVAVGPVGLLGCSQGAVVASIAGADRRGVEFMILIGGLGLPSYDVLVQQIRGLAAPVIDVPAVRASVEMKVMLLQLARAGAPADSIRAELTQRFGGVVGEERREALLAEYTCRRWRSALALDPAPVLGRCRMPILAIAGGADTLVNPKANLPKIQAALRAAGNRHVTAIELPGLTHGLCDAKADGDPAVLIAPRAMKVIIDWLRETTGQQRN